MAVKTQLTEDGQVLRISVPSRFDITVHKDFGEAYKDKAASISKCIIDMADAEYMDSSALGMLLMLKERIAGTNGAVEIVNCSDAIKRILAMAHFDRLFSVQ